ncbi:MAG: diguanylate cyclase [Candidatus Izimaplasma sp.]|nr:diguanylate cyclase [Candidatus Izimaplasma bacterium]
MKKFNYGFIVLISVSTLIFFAFLAQKNIRNNWETEQQKEKERIVSMIDTRTNTILEQINAINSIVKVSESGDLTQEKFASYVEEITNKNEKFYSISWAPDGVQTYSFPYDEEIIGHNLYLDEREPVQDAILNAIGTGQTVVSGPYPARQNSDINILVFRCPIFYDDGELRGFVNIVIESENLFIPIVTEASSNIYDYHVEDANGNILYGINAVTSNKEIIAFSANEFDWEIHLSLSNLYAANIYRTETIMIVAFFGSILLICVYAFLTIKNMVNQSKILSDSEKRYSTIYKDAPIGIALMDSITGEFIDVNENYAKICQRSIDELSQLNWASITHPDDMELDSKNMKRLNEGIIDGFTIEKRYITPGNSIVWVKMKVKRLKYEKEHLTHFAMIEDITQEKTYKNQLETKVITDALTNGYNRRFFEEKAKEFENDNMHLILIDINGLKLVNDAFGHINGDKVIIQTSEVIKDVFKNSFVFRIGGDEFAVIDHKLGISDLDEGIQKLRNDIEEINIKGMTISVSVGLSHKTPNKTFVETFTEAENYMYREKLNQVLSNRSSMINTILEMVHQKDPYSAIHSQRVSAASVKIGQLLEMSDNQINDIKAASLLHDIGKVIVPTKILNKSGKLTDKEYNEIKKHSEIGYRILKSDKSMNDIADIVLSHHERIDGKGYPQGIVKDSIPFESRIIAVADAMDAMLNNRIYRSKLSKAKCKSELINNINTQFCSKVVNVVIEHYNEVCDVIQEDY